MEPSEAPDAPWVREQENPINYKYNEPAVFKELQAYVDGTYDEHYVGENGVQTMDLLISIGLSDATCRGNIIKYASRMDKKGQARKDLLKILHYAVILLGTSKKL